jgi:hypothetical protein
MPSNVLKMNEFKSGQSGNVRGRSPGKKNRSNLRMRKLLGFFIFEEHQHHSVPGDSGDSAAPVDPVYKAINSLGMASALPPNLTIASDGRIAYEAFANAVKGRVPG